MTRRRRRPVLAALAHLRDAVAPLDRLLPAGIASRARSAAASARSPEDARARSRWSPTRHCRSRRIRSSRRTRPSRPAAPQRSGGGASGSAAGVACRRRRRAPHSRGARPAPAEGGRAASSHLGLRRRSYGSACRGLQCARRPGGRGPRAVRGKSGHRRARALGKPQAAKADGKWNREQTACRRVSGGAGR